MPLPFLNNNKMLIDCVWSGSVMTHEPHDVESIFIKPLTLRIKTSQWIQNQRLFRKQYIHLQAVISYKSGTMLDIFSQLTVWLYLEKLSQWLSQFLYWFQPINSKISRSSNIRRPESHHSLEKVTRISRSCYFSYKSGTVHCLTLILFSKQRFKTKL